MVGATFYVIKATTTMEAKVGALADVTGTVLRAASGGATIASTPSTSGGATARRLSGVIHGLGASHARVLSADHNVHNFHYAPSASALRKHAQGVAGVPDAILRQRRRRLSRRGLDETTDTEFERATDVLLNEIVPNEDDVLQQPDGTDVIVEELSTVAGRAAVNAINLFCQLVSEGQDPIQLTLNFAADGVDADGSPLPPTPMAISVSLSDSETVMSGCDSAHKTPAYGFSFDYFFVKFPFLFGPGGDGVSPLTYIFSCTSGLVPDDDGHLAPGFCSFSQVALIDSLTQYALSPESGVLASVDPVLVAQAEAAVLYTTDCTFDFVCPEGVPELCTLSSNSCLGPFEPTPGSDSAGTMEDIAEYSDNSGPTRRRLAEDVDAAAAVLQAAGIRAAGARALAKKFPEAVLYKSTHVSKSKKARALVTAHSEAKLARRRLAFKSPDQAAADLTAHNDFAGQPILPCTGPRNEEGHRACTLKDLCFAAPAMCLYGPIAPWGAHGAYGADTLPYLPCTDEDASSCGVDSAEDNFNLGAGLPTSWSGGLVNEASNTSFSQETAGAGTEKWLGRGARWGSYITCMPLINSLFDLVDGLVSVAGSDPLASLDDSAAAVKTKFDLVYACWCEKTPSCFAGLDKATPAWFMENAQSLAALKGGDVISRAYSLGIQIARPPAPDSPEIVDYFYGTLARIIDDIPRVASDTRIIAGGGAPFVWKGPADRTERLKQILELSFDPESVYTGNAAAGVDTTPYQVTPFGIGSVTWQHMVPCCTSSGNYIPHGPTAAAEAQDAIAEALSAGETAAIEPLLTVAYGCTAEGFPTAEAVWIPTGKAQPLGFSFVLARGNPSRNERTRLLTHRPPRAPPSACLPLPPSSPSAPFG